MKTNSLEKYFQEHYDNLYIFIFNRVNTKDVDEIVSNTWYRVQKYFDTYEKRNNASFKTWLFKIAINEMNLVNKKNNKQTDILNKLSISISSKSEENNYLEDYFSADIENCFMQLSNKHKEILQLIYLEKFSHKEAAEIIGTNEQATRALVYRAKKALKKFLLKERNLNE